MCNTFILSWVLILQCKIKFSRTKVQTKIQLVQILLLLLLLYTLLFEAPKKDTVSWVYFMLKVKELQLHHAEIKIIIIKYRNYVRLDRKRTPKSKCCSFEILLCVVNSTAISFRYFARRVRALRRKAEGKFCFRSFGTLTPGGKWLQPWALIPSKEPRAAFLQLI